MRWAIVPAAALLMGLAPAPTNFKGIWTTQWGGAGPHNAGTARMVITKAPGNSTEFDGMWDAPGFNGVLRGHVNGNVWSGDWSIPTGPHGTFSFKLETNGKFSGTWTRGTFSSFWNGTKVMSLP